MPPRYTLADDAVTLVLETSVRHVFTSTFGTEIRLCDSLTRDQLMERATLLSDYVRIYGDFSALLCIQLPRKLVLWQAQQTMGFDAFKQETFAGDQILRDTAGEIVNMLAGTFKNMLSRVKVNCRLLPPERFEDESELSKLTLAAGNSWTVNLYARDQLVQVILLSQE